TTRIGGRHMSRITSTARVSLASTCDRAGWLARTRDYIELTKPRIVMLELVTIVVAAHLASPSGIVTGVLLNTVLGAALVAARAGAVNHLWEQSPDALMTRTAVRPLPAGRLTSRQVIVFGVLTLILGSVELAFTVSLATAGVGLATWLIYVLVYTPLK